MDVLAARYYINQRGCFFFLAISCRQRQWNILRSLHQLPDNYTYF